jgi:hypothetical protein
MLPQVQLLPGAIAEILASVADTGYLTLDDRYGLMAAVLDEGLPEDDRRCANRLIRAVLQGRVKLLDQFPVAV